MVYNPFNVSLNSLLVFCFEFLHQFSSEILVCVFYIVSFSGFGYQGSANLTKRGWKCSLLLNFQEEFENWC